MAKEEKNIHAGHRDRLRNKALNSSADNLEEHEILEIMLSFVIPYKDTNPLAHELISVFGSLAGVIDANMEDLVKIDGIGEKTAKYLALQKTFFHAINESKKAAGVIINNTKDAVDYCVKLFDDDAVEKLYLICMNPHNKVIFTKLVSSGDYNKVNIDIKKLTQLALSHNSYRIILCHNHPDGRALPSYEDNKFTRAITMNMYINDVQLVDHIILGKGDYYSYHLSNVMSEYVEEAKKFFDKNN